MTTVTWAWRFAENGPEPFWDIAKNWSTGALPGPGDDVVVPAKTEPCSITEGDVISIQSLAVGGSLGIDGGQVSVSGGLTLEAGSGFEIDRLPLGSILTAGPATVTIGGAFTNDGDFAIGRIATVTMSSFDDESSGSGDIAGRVTITNVINSAGASASIGAGKDFGDKGGNLRVTGAFTDSGAFEVGNSGVATGASETMSAAGLDIGSAGNFLIVDATVTIGDVDNKGLQHGKTLGGFVVDFAKNASGDIATTSHVHVTGTFTNTGVVGLGEDGGDSVVTIKTFDNNAGGAVDIDSASVTIGNVDNAASSEAATPGGFGVDYTSSSDDSETGGSLKVTGTFTNTGDFAVGSILAGNKPSATTVTIAKLDNASTGGIQILAGTVTVTTLTNAGAPSATITHAGIGVDNLPAQPGGGDLTVKGTFTNTGDLVIGNSGLTGAATVNVGTLNNTGGIRITSGAASSVAELELKTAPSTWRGGIELVGGTSGIAGTAQVVMENNGQIKTIAAKSGFILNGVQAFVADANKMSSNSALAGLATIDGNLDLEQGAEVSVDGNLTNNGQAAAKGGIAIDLTDESASSSLTVAKALTNKGDIGLGNAGAGAVDDEVALTVGSLDNTADAGVGITNVAMEVKGNLTNAGVGDDNGIGLDITDGASGGKLTVGGELINSGDVGVGNAKDDGSTFVELGSLSNLAAGSIGVEQATFHVDGNATNTGVGEGNGIGVDFLKGESGGSFVVEGKLTNDGDIGLGNGSGGSTSATWGSLNNETRGSISLDNAALIVNGAVVNAGVGDENDIDNGIGVDFVNGDSGGELTITGKLTNSGAIGIGNIDGGSTTATIGSLDNVAKGLIGIEDATVDIKGALVNAGAGVDGIDVGEEVDATNSSLTVGGSATNSGAFVIGVENAAGGAAQVSAASFTNSGVVEINESSSDKIGTLAVKETYSQSGKSAVTAVDGLLTATTIQITGGTLEGAGAIIGQVVNTAGDIVAGSTLVSPGRLSIGEASAVGSYKQGAKGAMTELLQGVGANAFGTLAVNGAVSLGGTLNVDQLGGFKFKAGEMFEIMTFKKGGLTGTFSAIDDGSLKGNAHDVVLGGGLDLVALYNSASGQIDLDVQATTVTVAQFKADESILNQIVGGFAISDSAANIQANVAALQADASHIDSVAFTGSGTHVLTLTKAQATADAALVKKFVGSYVLDVDNAGATTTTGHGNDLTIDAVAAGHDTITGGGSSETFVFDAKFGQDTIVDFASHAEGAGHDLISLPSSDFQSFSLMMKAAANIDGNVVITAKDGDKLTLDHLTVAALGGLTGDFKFSA